jgi:hypothetical protein
MLQTIFVPQGPFTSPVIPHNSQAAFTNAGRRVSKISFSTIKLYFFAASRAKRGESASFVVCVVGRRSFMTVVFASPIFKALTAFLFSGGRGSQRGGIFVEVARSSSARPLVSTS